MENSHYKYKAQKYHDKIQKIIKTKFVAKNIKVPSEYKAYLYDFNFVIQNGGYEKFSKK